MPDATAAEEGLPVENVLSGFTGGIGATPVSLLYQLGLILAVLMMGLLPVVYVALTGVTAYGVYYYATHAFFLVQSMRWGIQITLLRWVAYGAPLFAGVVMVFFMVKPLFARRRRQAQPLALNPEVERTLFGFIARICHLIGAPMPKRIDLDCQLNASARFRRGASSALEKGDLALTIGLPLVAGLDARELAGVIAHEFGHFTQGFGMRLSYFVRSINGWFARVVYDRDAWDVSLEAAQAGCRDWRMSMILACAQLGVWFSRLILKGLMMIGHGACCFLLRQMEYDADSYQIKLAGSAAFEATMLRYKVLETAIAAAYKEMRVGWNNDRSLADNLPQYFMDHAAKIPVNKKEGIMGSSGLARTKIFDTHPSLGDRIRKARRANEPGVFALDLPASCLFVNFGAISRQVTLLHYQDDLGIPTAAIKLRAAMGGREDEAVAAAAAKPAPKPIRMRVSLPSVKPDEPRN